MITIDDLKNVRRQKLRVESLQERIERLRSRAEYTQQQLGECGRSDPTRDRLAEYVAELDELERQLTGEIIALVSLYEKGAENAKRTTLLSLARFFNVSLDYLADDEVEERGTRIYASAGHFDVTKLTPEGRERYEEYIEFLADKFTK